IAIGSVLGILAARLVAMTAMPEMVALLNGSGGIASLFVGWSVYHYLRDLDAMTSITTALSVLIGGVTFTGSVIAWGKLSEKISSKPLLYPGQKIVNSLLLLSALVGTVIFCINPAMNYPVFIGYPFVGKFIYFL
ncbi:MAG: NAD synthetase, partial [Candidatus Moranbacteria bacterium]|nr:NAD synthetase [Candidatus Moranbacteria bacterium]